ncbi:hypothetical protein FACS1894199_05350 [Bacteroidia bacterium]|nr:hypothetical protein FACS1894199_05350 [Bacteroidia bacterium]
MTVKKTVEGILGEILGERFFGALSSLLLVTLLASCDSGSKSGVVDTTIGTRIYTVIDYATRVPIEDATLEFSDGRSNTTAVTGPDGEAWIELPVKNNYNVTVTKEDYASVRTYATSGLIALRKSGASLVGYVTLLTKEGNLEPGNEVVLDFSLTDGDYLEKSFVVTTETTGEYKISNLPEGENYTFPKYIRVKNINYSTANPNDVTGTSIMKPHNLEYKYVPEMSGPPLSVISLPGTVRNAGGEITAVFNRAITPHILEVKYNGTLVSDVPYISPDDKTVIFSLASGRSQWGVVGNKVQLTLDADCKEDVGNVFHLDFNITIIN